ncbi:hypothetical protein GS501_05845 [Saccharibacter sp. 17.LH.SD]|nr:hypothetical protein [Saccharibacter sp. 17.LH.SD]
MPDGPTSGSFTVMDERAPDEISEVSRLYINGHLAATFQLDLTHSSAQVTVPIPLGRTDLSYSLCGAVTMSYNGRTVTRIVSSDGTLHNPDGRNYEAVGNEHFTDFFLVDPDDPSAEEHLTGHSARCTVPNS